MAEFRLSTRALANATHGDVAYTTINELSNDKGGSPSVSTLQAIARGFKRGPEIEEELFRVARGLPVDPENAPYRTDQAKLLYRWEQLGTEHRKAVLRFMKFQLLEIEKGTDDFTEEEIGFVLDENTEV